VVSHAPPCWELWFGGIESLNRVFAGRDLFEALITLRCALEEAGAQLLCQGARPEVFPTGMSRDMGGGRKAYVTGIGVSPSRPDFVDILDYAEPNCRHGSPNRKRTLRNGSARSDRG